MRALLLLVAIGCGSGGGFPDAPLHEPPAHPGEFAVTWSITDQHGAALSCQSANAIKVLVGIADSSGARNSVSFDCGLGSAVSGALFVGTYDLDFTLTGPAGQLAIAPRQQSVVIQSNRTLAIPALTFVVTK